VEEILYSPNSTWLDSTRLDTFDVSNPCILAVSTLSNSTARLTRHVELDWLDVLDTSSSTGLTRLERLAT